MSAAEATTARIEIKRPAFTSCLMCIPKGTPAARIMFPKAPGSPSIGRAEQGVLEAARIEAALLQHADAGDDGIADRDRKSTRLNSSHLGISYAVFCLKKTTRHNLLR